MARILIADDEEDFSLLLQRALAAAGHEIRPARDGNEAINALKAAPADLAIVDIFMPGKDGIETIQEVRRLFPSVKIIAITGSVAKTSSSLLVMAQKLGAQLVLSKPFSVEQILAAVNGLLGKSGA
jgi:CheY-like chemotaxis protein